MFSIDGVRLKFLFYMFPASGFSNFLLTREPKIDQYLISPQQIFNLAFPLCSLDSLISYISGTKVA